MKYMGSKSRISKYIVPIIQKEIDFHNIKTYIEPFVGGANVIDKIRCEKKIGSDLNKYLIALHNWVKDGNPLLESVSKETYDKYRNAYNSGDTSMYKDWEVANVGFLASYNGRWFDGGYAKSVYEKTKNGTRIRDYYAEAKRNIEEQSNGKLYKKIEFLCDDYQKYNAENTKNCLIYCDPPYIGTKGYTNSNAFDYNKFWNWCRKMGKQNIVIISEQNAPDDFICIWEQKVSRSIKPNDKRTETEKLFVYSRGWY